jgi:hypothetical protein
MKSNSVSKKPLEIKNGNITVKIYAGKNRVNGASYPQFTPVHYLGSQRIKRKFADLKEAKVTQKPFQPRGDVHCAFLALFQVQVKDWIIQRTMNRRHFSSR